MQAIGRGVRVQVWPEQVHDLLPMQPVRPRESEELDQVSCIAQPPLFLPDDPGPHRHPEIAQQLDAHSFMLPGGGRRIRIADRVCHPYGSSSWRLEFIVPLNPYTRVVCLRRASGGSSGYEPSLAVAVSLRAVVSSSR